MALALVTIGLLAWAGYRIVAGVSNAFANAVACEEQDMWR